MLTSSLVKILINPLAVERAVFRRTIADIRCLCMVQGFDVLPSTGLVHPHLEVLLQPSLQSVHACRGICSLT